MDTPWAHGGGLDDEALLARVASGDRIALVGLLDRYGARVFSLAKRRLTAAELAEEVVAQVFAEAWRGANGFRGRCRVSTWLYGITQYKCDRLQQRTR